MAGTQEGTLQPDSDTGDVSISLAEREDEVHAQAFSEDDVATESERVPDEITRLIPFDSYKMKHPERGYALIINNREFEEIDGVQLDERMGTHMDNKKMIALLKELKFKTIMKSHDASMDEMIDLFNEAASVDYTSMDCFMCVILTYGTQDGYILASDGLVKLEDLMKRFKYHGASQTLLGKPKIFFIQADYSEELDMRNEDLDNDAKLEPEDDTDHQQTLIIQIPTEADFFIGYSSVPGSLDEKDGSWFIQSLYKVFKENYTKDDLVSLMTTVVSRVMDHFKDDEKRLLPVLKSTLTKKVFFS